MNQGDSHICQHCGASLREEYLYCPQCGQRKKRRIDVLYGATILYMLSLVLAVSFGLIGYHVFNTHEALAGALFAMAAALGPVALLGIIYDRLVKGALREAASASFSDLSQRLCRESIADMEHAAQRLTDISKVGLIAAFPERRYAFPYLVDAIRAERKEIYIVGTSFRGLIDPQHGDEEIMRAIRERIDDPHCTVRFLLTHPAFAHLRQKLEGIQRLEEFHIAQEIFQTLVELKAGGVPHRDIRFVKATPTVFGVMTSKLMLLNPYPYQAQAFASVTFLFDAHDSENAVFQAFKKSHFEGVWEGDNVVALKSYKLIDIQTVFGETLETLKLATSDKKVHFGNWDKKGAAAKNSIAGTQ